MGPPRALVGLWGALKSCHGPKGMARVLLPMQPHWRIVCQTLVVCLPNIPGHVRKRAMHDRPESGRWPTNQETDPALD
eukprot:8757987-Lingulodinium_polyedra.AAC.1